MSMITQDGLTHHLDLTAADSHEVTYSNGGVRLTLPRTNEGNPPRFVVVEIAPGIASFTLREVSAEGV